MSQLTTHILDTSKGVPAAGIEITLYRQQVEKWIIVTVGQTNSDGRVPNLLNGDATLQEGIYKLRFETKPYFETQGILSFYPFVEIVFSINSTEHYHVPLLISPFGYSTYRGS